MILCCLTMKTPNLLKISHPLNAQITMYSSVFTNIDRLIVLLCVYSQIYINRPDGDRPTPDNNVATTAESRSHQRVPLSDIKR